MKKEEFVPGQCYTFRNSSCWWISVFKRWENNTMKVSNGSIALEKKYGEKNEYFTGESWGSYSSIEEIRLSTPEEIQWLKDCYKASALMPQRPLESINYQIF